MVAKGMKMKLLRRGQRGDNKPSQTRKT